MSVLRLVGPSLSLELEFPGTRRPLCVLPRGFCESAPRRIRDAAEVLLRAELVTMDDRLLGKHAARRRAALSQRLSRLELARRTEDAAPENGRAR